MGNDAIDQTLEPLVSTGSPFELFHCERGHREFRHAPRNLIEILERAERRARAHNSIAFVMNDVRLSVRGLFAIANRITDDITKEIKWTTEPPRIALAVPDGILWLECFVAVLGTGATAVLIPFSEDIDAMARLISSARCDLILSIDGVSIDLQAISPSKCLVVDKSRASHEGFHESSDMHLREPQSRLGFFGRPHPDDAAIIAFTSGSMGDAKGVILSHRGVTTGLWNMMLNGAWASRRNATKIARHSARPPSISSTLMLAPLTHVSGYSQFLLILIGSGRMVLMDRWRTNDALVLIENECVTGLVGASPASIRQLLREYARRQLPVPLESFSVHGSSLHRSLAREILAAAPHARLATGYGMTETNGAISTSFSPEFLEHSTCGPVPPTVDLRVIDNRGRPAGMAIVGEIFVRGTMLFVGYCAATGDTRVPTDQWFPTGDVGSVDAGGLLRIVDRRSEVIHLSERDIFCSDIERVLDEWQCCEECLAVTIDHRSRCLVGIVPRNAAQTDLLEIAAILERILNLPKEQVDLVWRTSLPKTRSGKPSRNKLLAEWRMEQRRSL